MLRKLKNAIPASIKLKAISLTIRLFNLVRKLTPLAVRNEILSYIKEPNKCIATAVRFVCWNQIPGDYLEFGCYSGRTFSYAYNHFQNCREEVSNSLTPEDRISFEKARPRFFAFDSFEGLPVPIDKDQHPYVPRHWKTGNFSMSEKQFKKILATRGVQSRDVVVVKGWYNDTLTHETKRLYNLKRASIVHIDCDYYKSSIDALNFVTDLVDDGTVIIFDDYNFFRGSPHFGERRAFSEWLETNPHVKATELARHDFDKVAFFLSVDKEWKELTE